MPDKYSPCAPQANTHSRAIGQWETAEAPPATKAMLLSGGGVGPRLFKQSNELRGVHLHAGAHGSGGDAAQHEHAVSEFLITLFSGFAQAESESLSKNVAWGKQKSAEAGKVTFQYKKMLGYQKGADGQPEIVPEEAEIVRRIYHRYLDGCTLGQIKRELEEDGVPT